MLWDIRGPDVRSVSSSVRTMGAERREDVLLAGILGLAGLVEVALGAVPGHALVASLSLLVMTEGPGERPDLVQGLVHGEAAAAAHPDGTDLDGHYEGVGVGVAGPYWFAGRFAPRAAASVRGGQVRGVSR